MSTSQRPQIPKWEPPATTKENLDYIQLANLDLSKFDDPESRKELAQEFFKAFTEEGFVTITGHGISKETWDMQMDLANATMTMPPEDKVPYEVTKEEDEQGVYVGFKTAGGLGFHKEIDFYNMLLNDPQKGRKHPPHLAPYMEDTRKVMLHMSYAPLSPEAIAKARGLFMPAHADWGTFSILFSQPVSALQILHKSGVYKWVEYKPYTLIVNVGQALELLTGGLFPATIHRVVTPPPDQVNSLRVGIFYFSRPNDDYPLRPLPNSPVLKVLGRDKPLDPNVTYTTAEFLEAKKHGYLKPELDFDRPRDTSIHRDPFCEGDRFAAIDKPLTSIIRQKEVSA